MRSAAGDDLPRHTDDDRVGGHRLHHNGIGSDSAVVTDRDGTEHLRPGADRDPIANGRMTLHRVKARATKGDSLVDGHIVAYFSCLTDHHATSMIDEHTLAEDGGRMNLHSRQPSRQTRARPGQEFVVAAPERVADAMAPERVNARVAQRDLD